MQWMDFWDQQTAKARLVVLGFHTPNLTSVETASPTMSRVGRNLILVVASMLGLKVKAGDVSSAFLQTTGSLESEGLTVYMGTTGVSYLFRWQSQPAAAPQSAEGLLRVSARPEEMV